MHAYTEGIVSTCTMHHYLQIQPTYVQCINTPLCSFSRHLSYELAMYCAYTMYHTYTYVCTVYDFHTFHIRSVTSPSLAGMTLLRTPGCYTECTRTYVRMYSICVHSHTPTTTLSPTHTHTHTHINTNTNTTHTSQKKNKRT